MVIEKMRKKLSECYRKRPDLLETRAMRKELKKKIRQAEIEEKTKAALIKIGQLIDLCFELIPITIAERIRDFYQKQVLKKVKGVKTEETSNNLPLSELFLKITYEAYKVFGQRDRGDREVMFTGGKSRHFHVVDKPRWAINDHSIECKSIIPYPLPSKYSSITTLIENIKKRKMCKCYTDALVEIIYSLMDNDFIWVALTNESYIDCLKDDVHEIDFKDFAFIGELLIEMGAINSALKLYAIDGRVFNRANVLELLVDKITKTGDLELSNKLLGKLIEQEPYHPSIPSIQAEIKRLEQRDRLKSTFSIDFSKIDELSGIEFENLLSDKFAAMRFKVESTPKTGDFGADLIVENSEGTRIIVQCKRFKSKVNLKAVQEVVGAMGHYAGDLGVVITSNSFLSSAVKLAESHDIELWDGDKLVGFLAGDLSFSQVFS